MPIDMFIRIGDIQGESTDSQHPDEIDVLSYSWGAENPGSPGSGRGGGGAGRVSYQDLTLTKYVDSATPPLMLTCATGAHIRDAVLTLRSAGEASLEFLVITLENVQVTSWSQSVDQADERATEDVSLRFARVEVVYTPQGPDGGALPPVRMGWDLATNTQF